MKIKLDETEKVISILNTGIDDNYRDLPELPSDHEFGVVDYAYIDGKYVKVPSKIHTVLTNPQPTLEERVTEIEQVTTEVFEQLNDKGLI